MSFRVISYNAPLKVIAGHVIRRARLAWTDWQSVRRLPTCPTCTFIDFGGPQGHGTPLWSPLGLRRELRRGEYEIIVRRGFLLQLDCPDLALERHLSYQDRPLGDFLGFVERVVATINTALENVPREKVRLHVCWGNYEGPHDCDVPLADILPVIKQANVGAFFFPFANPRHAHEYRVFEKLPLAEDQIIIAGVIDSLTNFVEHPEAVADRLERVAAAVGDPHRVIAGTDCGFDTSAGMGRVAEDVVWAKLKSLAEGARIASDRLGMQQ